MVVTGEGGTGKSVLIDAITETFTYHGQESALAKCAPCAIAATHVGGCTIHMWAGLGINRPKSICNCSKRIELCQKKNILGKRCLIVDEMSMLHTTLLTDVARVVAYVKKNGQQRRRGLAVRWHACHIDGRFSPISTHSSRQHISILFIRNK